MAKSHEESTTVGNKPQIETAGEVFSDGTIVELVRDQKHSEQLRLLAWKGTQATVAPRIDYGGRTYVPPVLDRSILDALRLPTYCRPYGSTQDLFTDLSGLFSRYANASEECGLLLTPFVLSTWTVDWLPLAPTLANVGPVTGARIQLLQLLHCLCRRGLLLAELTAAGLCSLPMWLRATLLINQPELSTSVQRLLRDSNRRGVRVARNGQLVDLYCAKAIFTTENLGDAGLCGGALQIRLSPSRRPLPVLDEQVQEQIANEFQPKLLAYRLANHAKVRDSKFDVPEFTSPLRELARSLGVCIVDAPEFQARIVSLLQDQDEEIRSDRTLEPESVVIEAVLFFCHQAKKDSVRVGEVAKAVNAILAGRGETIQLQPRAVGEYLKSLALRTRRLGKAGRGLLLDHKMRRDVHRLARDYEVPSVQDAEDRCPHCVERIQPPKEAEGARGAHGVHGVHTAHVMHKNHQRKSKGGGAA